MNTRRGFDLLFVIVACKRTSDKVNNVPFVDALNDKMYTTGIKGRVIKARKLGFKYDERSQMATDQKLGAERNSFLTRNPAVSQKEANTGCC